MKEYKVSKPQELIYKICCRLFGSEHVEQEFGLEGGYRIDVVVPRYRLAVEYHGQQHFEYNPFFHRTHDDFLKLQFNDTVKRAMCLDKGWAYVQFSYKDRLNDNLISNRILDALLKEQIDYTAPMERYTKTKNEVFKQKQKEYRKERYRRTREWKRNFKAS